MRRKSIDDVRRVFEDFGYTLLSSHYENNRAKLMYVCPNGHEGSISYANFTKGRRCPVCRREESSFSRRTPFSTVISVFEKEGYKVLSPEEYYRNNKSYIKFECPRGHIDTIRYANFLSGHRCNYCTGHKRGGTRLPVLTTSFTTRDDNLCSGAACIQKEMVLPLVNAGFNIWRSRSSVIPPYKLDIFIPEKNVAVEYCILYRHSEFYGEKPRDYHYTKMILCHKKGIRLITVFEDEFVEKRDVVLSRIYNALGITDRRIYARKCELRQISNVQANDFFNQYHLQGPSRSLYSYGLFYEDVLVQAMSFGVVSRAHASKVEGRKVAMLELKRMCTLPYTVVVGGTSRLFKAGVREAKNRSYTYIKSYSDNRYSDINPVYERLGFSLISETKYTPHYVMNGVRYRNMSLRKTAAERTTGKTEWELRRSQGYDRIWDCGHKTYLYKIT